MSVETKCCPFCAEEIRAAAVLCKHCNRDVHPTSATSNASSAPSVLQPGPGGAPPARRRSGVLLGVLGGAIGAVGLLAALGSQSPQTSTVDGIGPDTGPVAVAPPTIVRIADTTGLEIAAQHYYVFTWHVRDDRPCRLTGRVAGLAGGRKDIEVLVLTADDLENWKEGLTTAPVFQTGQVAAHRLDVVLPGPGAYRLVLNNAFSLVTDKVVQVENASVTCG